jgi:hypothetical protein
MVVDAYAAAAMISAARMNITFFMGTALLAALDDGGRQRLGC